VEIGDIKIRALLVLLAVFSVICVTAYGEEPPVPVAPMAQTVVAMDLTNVTVPQAAVKLASAAHVPVAVEYLESPYVAAGEPKGKTVSVAVSPNMTVEAALNAAVAQDSRYEWKFSNGWLHMMPRTRAADYPLDRPYRGELSVTGYVGTDLMTLGRSLPSDWNTQLTSLGSRVAGSPKAATPLASNAAVRDAIDATLLADGARCWRVIPSKTADNSVEMVVEVVAM
jgi:hypothetical protein